MKAKLKRVMQWLLWSPARIACILLALAVITVVAVKLAGRSNGPDPDPAPTVAGTTPAASVSSSAPAAGDLVVLTVERFMAGWAVKEGREELLKPVAETSLYATLTAATPEERVTVTPDGSPTVLHLETNLAIAAHELTGEDTVWLFLTRNTAATETGWWVFKLIWQDEAQAALDVASRFLEAFNSPDKTALEAVTEPSLYEALATGPSAGELGAGTPAAFEAMTPEGEPVIIDQDERGIHVRQTYDETTLVVVVHKTSQAPSGWWVIQVENR
jgi:hypothetical protein